MSSHLSWRDAALALAIVFVWGTNFVVIRLGLDALPPLFFATLRFIFVFAPAFLLLPRPKVSWANLAFYGVCIGLFQFGLLFIAMKGHISPGLASLVVQMQVFFTIGLAMWRKGEKLKPHQLGAFVLALAGMGVIAAHNGQGTTILGVVLVLGAAMGWALGNQAGREAGPVNWAAVLWQSVGNTMFGYACWAWLLSRYPAATVAPMSLLVPVFGFAASATILGEPLPLWKIGATLLIMAGLAVNLLWRPRKAAISGEAC